MKKLLVIITLFLSAHIINSQILQNDSLMPHWLNRQGPSRFGEHLKQAQHAHELQEKDLQHQRNLATSKLQEFKAQLLKTSKLATHKGLNDLFATAIYNVQTLEKTMENLRTAIEEETKKEA